MIQTGTISRQISPKDGLWPNESDLIVVKDVQSAQAALEAVIESFNPQKFGDLLAGIDKSTFYPVVPNPKTEDYKGKKFYEVKKLARLCYICANMIS
jgi:hypothetical protein